MTEFLTSKAPFFLNDAVGTASGEITVPGYTDMNSGTASAYVLSGPPYVGAEVCVYKTGSASAGVSIITDAAGSTLNTDGDRTITLTSEGDFVQLLGISDTRWQIVGGNFGPTS